MNDLTSIEYLQNYILNVERDLKSYVDQELKKSHNIDVDCFDEMLNIIHVKKIHQSHRIEFYDVIYNNTILEFKSHQNDEFLLYGLRFLFAFPTYFIETNSENRKILLNTLIDVVLTKEEPLPTHAIKCLQIALHIFRNTKLKKISFKLLTDILIKRVSDIFQFIDPNILIPVFKLNREKDDADFFCFDAKMKKLVDRKINELQIESLNITFYLDVGFSTNGYMQIFYHMALLKYIVYHLEVSELVRNTMFWDLLYSCINVTICKNENIIILALAIILEHIDNPDFLFQFLKTNGVAKICVVPHCLKSSSYVSSILSKIIKNSICKEKLIKKHLDYVIHYGISFFGSLNTKKSCKIIINLFCDQDYYEIFINENGIKLIFENVKKNKQFIDMKKYDLLYHDLNISFNMIKEEIRKFIKILLLHIFIQILSITPIKIKNSFPKTKSNKINHDSYDIVLDYFENLGGFKHRIEFFEELIEIGNIEVFVSILRMTIPCIRNPWKMEIYKDLMYFLKFLSLYHRSKALYIHPFDLCPEKSNNRNTLVVLFRSIPLKNHDNELDDYFLQFIPFQAYNNLLASCFANLNTCKIVLKLKYYFDINDDDNDVLGLKHDEISNFFMDSLIINSYIYQIFKLLPSMKFDLKIKIYAIKCLLMLLTRKLAIPIVSGIKENFIPKFTQSLVMIINYGGSDRLTRIFLIYSLTLIFKLNRNSYFQSINNISFSTSTKDDLDRDQRLKYLMRNEKKGVILSRRDTFLIFKSCIYSIKKNESYRQKLNFCFELIHRSFSLYLSSIEDLKCSKNYLYANERINDQVSMSPKIGLRYKTHRRIFKTIRNKFAGVTNYFDRTNNKKIYDAKMLIDDTIVFADSEGISHVSPCKGSYTQSSERICYIDDSYNGEFIIGCGISNRSDFRFTNIWKYNPLISQKKIKPKNIYVDMSYSKITNDNNYIFGIARNLNAKMIDIETSQILTKFWNENIKRLPSLNCASNSNNGNLLLFNGDLFCTRSKKLINSFPYFNQHLSGIFVHSDTRILINCELWDLRTRKLFCQINEIENFIVKNTYTDDILIGVEREHYYKTNNMNDHFDMWKKYIGVYEKKMMLYDIKTLSQIKIIDSNSYIMFAHISRDCTKITVGKKTENYHGPCESFQILSIGNESYNSFN